MPPVERVMLRAEGLGRIYLSSDACDTNDAISSKYPISLLVYESFLKMRHKCHLRHQNRADLTQIDRKTAQCLGPLRYSATAFTPCSGQ